MWGRHELNSESSRNEAGIYRITGSEDRQKVKGAGIKFHKAS